LAAKLLRTEFGDARVHADQWIVFEDSHGRGYLCVDAFVVGTKCVLIVECKLTYTPDMAWWQMEKRYAPVLRHIFGLPTCTLQVCKNLRYGIPAESLQRRTPRYLLENPEPGRFTYHWLGR